jgi:glycosyltransferase involved in cell wall biosynthesis
MLQSSDQVTAVSSWAAKQVARNEGIPTRRIRVISNGVEENEDSGLGNQREDLGLEKGRPLLLQVGRLDPLKDVATSLRVMKRLQGDVQAILVLIGEGPDRGRLETMAQSLHLEDSVMFMGARREVAAWMSAADVLLHTSLSEALPLVLLEAMEAGLPVVAADVGGVRELVMDGRTGLLAGVGDDLQLTNHILRLLRDPRLAESMGRTGRERVRRHFREDTMVQNYEQSYWSILRGSMGWNARSEQKANGSPSARL